MTDDLWRRALRDSDVEVRRDALEQLAHAPLDAPGVLDDVVLMLEEDDALVVDAAAFALGEHLFVAAVVPLCAVAAEP